MAIYDFKNQILGNNILEAGAQFVFMDVARQSQPIQGISGASGRVTDTNAWNVKQSSHPRDDIIYGEDATEPVDVYEGLEPGFRYLDEAMKAYWADIRIPTKDSFRFMRTKVAGASKSLQVWKDDLLHGRVTLPVMSISRTSHEYNKEYFTPPYLPMRSTFTNRAGTHKSKVFRPVPYIVGYTFTIWAEFKRDIEYALKQILIRYNPLAEFIASDNSVYGPVIMEHTGANDVSEKDAPADQKAKLKYEINIKALAWLSLPEQIYPTILGNVVVSGENIVKENIAYRRLLWSSNG